MPLRAPTTLRLRSPDGPLRIHLAQPLSRSTLSVLVLITDADPPQICRALADELTILTIATERATLRDGTRLLEWTADHATELGADPDQLLLGGAHAGAWLAAYLALRARDDGWPVIRHQLLVHPRRFPAIAMSTSLTGAPPATIIGPPTASHSYAHQLRLAGVAVTVTAWLSRTSHADERTRRKTAFWTP